MIETDMLVVGSGPTGSSMAALLSTYGVNNTLVGGDGWIEAAKRASSDSGVEIAAITIGPGCYAEDPFGGWAKAREIADDGCLLVGPDMYIDFRAQSASPRVSADLGTALARILGKQS